MMVSGLIQASHSMALLLEFEPSGYLKHLRHNQHSLTIVLLRLQTRQDEHKLHLFMAHPRRRKGTLPVSPNPNHSTNFIAQTFAGIGVLDLLHNTSAAFYVGDYSNPSNLVRILTGVGFGLGALVSDWIFGACLVYDLTALSVGQSGSWSTLLWFYTVGCAAIVGAKNFLM